MAAKNVWRIETVEAGAFSTELYIVPIEERGTLTPDQLKLAKIAIDVAIFTPNFTPGDSEWIEHAWPWNYNHRGMGADRAKTKTMIAKLNKDNMASLDKNLSDKVHLSLSRDNQEAIWLLAYDK